MEQDYFPKRHSQLWEERTKRVGRVVIAGLLFGALLQLNVLDSWSEIKPAQVAAQLDIERLHRDKAVIDEQRTALRTFGDRLAEVESTIRNEPWATEMEKLRKWFREESSGRSEDVMQQRADETLEEIAKVVQAEVVDGLQVDGLDELEAPVQALGGFLGTIREMKGERWWTTLDGKADALREIRRDLEQRIEPISDQLQTRQAAIAREIEDQEKRIAELSRESEEGEKEIAALQQRMDRILPEWIRGLITVEQMVKVYPWVIIVLVLYVVVLALSAAEHYRYMVTALQVKESDKTNPAMSSLWTLTNRGGLHTALTYGSYLLFTGGMFVLYELGLRALRQGLEGTDMSLIVGLGWVGRAAFAVAFVLIGRSLFTARSAQPGRADV